MRKIAIISAIALVLVALGGWLAIARKTAPDHRPALGLFTTLPILWNEAPDVAAQLQDSAPPHWVKAALERRFRVVPLDTLDKMNGVRMLLMAQPRALSPAENVALDDWVRGGGQVLLFADPMLTWESAFPIGDPRRPQDVVLLSPILTRWGLELTFDDGQPGGLREIAGNGLPVNLPGRLRLRSGAAASCRIGAGKAIIVADAAVLEPSPDPVRAGAAVVSLLLRAFGP